MHFVRLSLLVASVFLALISVMGQPDEEKYYEQKLDHTGVYPGTWKQRYLENRENFRPGGPVFIVLGGPFYAPITPEVLRTGSMVQYAKQQGANLIGLESRFFGKSRPTKDLSTENLDKYGTLENLIQDGTEFIKWLKSQPDFKNAKVVVFGVAYLGARILQSMRLDPGVIDIGILSTAPVEARFEIPEVMKHAVEQMKKDNPECATTVHDTVLCFDKIINGESCEGHNIKDLKDTFNLCADVDPRNSLNNAALVGEILRMIQETVLFGSPNTYNVHKMCEGMGDTSKGLSHMDKLAAEMKKILMFSGKKCLEFRLDTIVSRLQNTKYEHDASKESHPEERQIFYFRCKHVLTLQTPAGLDLDDSRLESFKNYTLEMCRRLFNISPEEVQMGSQKADEKYGMRKLPEKCAIFVSEAEDLGDELEVTSQEEAGQCNAVVRSAGGGFRSDAQEIGEADPEGATGLRDAQLKISRIIDQWLKTGNCCAPVAKKRYHNFASILNVGFK